jgi:hypothetical protein
MLKIVSSICWRFLISLDFCLNDKRRIIDKVN